ncbi:MAG: hypothetical protein JSU07_02480 [Bacteroidetes bacterium]|nr:hypothetical protein [Bacteroidota bacterium]
MKFNAPFWIKFSLINIMLVAALGTLMRYKIGYDFPYLTQKNIQHAHSHFAFAGWISHSLFTLIVFFITNRVLKSNIKQYNYLLALNLIFSYGMLISFFVFGYNFVSIALSTLTILNSYVLAYFMFKDFKKFDKKHPSIIWFKAAMWFNIISSAGPYYLAYIMISKRFDEHMYFASVYYYLHFQYNGFFTFTCFGLIVNRLKDYLPDYKYNPLLFKLFFIACIPSYFLSTLWLNIPVWLYVMVVISAFVQFFAWILFLKEVRIALRGENFIPKYARFMFLFVGIAYTVKLCLQLGSTIPELSKLAFGFRPVVIAYLHLVLLAVFSVFLLAYFFTRKFIKTHKKMMFALSLFLLGVFLNEAVLAVQGIASFAYFPIKHINDALFVVAVFLLLGAGLIILFDRKKHEEQSARY